MTDSVTFYMTSPPSGCRADDLLLGTAVTSNDVIPWGRLKLCPLLDRGKVVIIFVAGNDFACGRQGLYSWQVMALLVAYSDCLSHRYFTNMIMRLKDLELYTSLRLDTR
ncbi:hypothetical protein Btru_016416 [Bulinus truncatus]|nr:hypothetical protein Btru_016416 [Bulinus truncatus]